MVSATDSIDTDLSKLREIVKKTAKPGVCCSPGHEQQRVQVRNSERACLSVLLWDSNEKCVYTSGTTSNPSSNQSGIFIILVSSEDFTEIFHLWVRDFQQS